MTQIPLHLGFFFGLFGFFFLQRKQKKKEGGEGETKLRSVGRMKEESGGRSVEEAAYGCRKSTAGGSISIWGWCQSSWQAAIHPTSSSSSTTPPRSFIVSLSGSLGELVVCVCVFVAADQRQLEGGGGGRGGGRWYLVPPPTSPPLCICPSQFEQRGFFLFVCFLSLTLSLFFCLPLLFFYSPLLPTHWFRVRRIHSQSEASGYSATLELIKLMRTAAGIVLCVCACIQEQI